MNKTKICLAILAAVPYLAQAEHEGTVHLDEVKVVAKKNKASLTQPDIETAKENLSKTAGGTTVVNMETVREGRTSNMQDTLGMATGVLAQSRFGAEETRLSIRGSGLQRTFHGRGLKLMQDGIAVNLADGGFDFPAIDPMATDYIEVYRGANALQYGSTNLGGSINFISRTGYTAPALEVRSEGGSYGYYRLGVSTGGVKDNVDYFVSASKYHSDSFRDNAQQGADRLTGNVGIRLNEQVETRFFFGYVNNDSQLSSSLTKAQLKDDPKQATVTAGQGINQRNINVTRVANKTTILFDQSKLELGAYYARKGLFHPIGNFGDTTGVIDQESYDIGLTARWAYQGELFGLKNEFVAGLSPTRGRTDAKNYLNVNARRGALLNDFDQKATNFETYLEDRLSLDEQWTVIAGLQYAKSKRDSQDQMITASGDQSVDKTYSQTSPKLGVLYQLQPQVQVFANASRSFEPPSFGELNSLVVSSLKAQKGTTFEIGSRGNSEFVDWDVAFYQARLQDELLQVGAAGSPFASQTINAGKTIHRGLEFGLTARLPYSLQWRSSLLINDFKLDNDPTFGSNRLPGIQRSLLRAELVYRGSDVLENFYIGPTIEWSPQRYNVDFAETLYADSYFLWGMKAGQKINQHWSWFIEGRNLANQKYAATTGVVADATRAFTSQAQFFPGDGRTAYLGVTWTY
ncbi:TonB-dependent receptor family protein [Methylophilus sp. UBA6697]|uniref:TonB-dependent receptor family protein n=1 Tax=Methylophilus sp. UBA6697 TaxID=1946902 RepID=UPI0025E62C93|nr:TonB-dependent receptor [Methylophilus sp. UBA6697]